LSQLTVLNDHAPTLQSADFWNLILFKWYDSTAMNIRSCPTPSATLESAGSLKSRRFESCGRFASGRDVGDF
jgi:hypothetical protein